jgi:tetratricopeptide (TPR) repeat protein
MTCGVARPLARLGRFAPVLALTLVAVAIYANSLQVPFIFDDNYSIAFFGHENLWHLLLHGSSRRVADFTLALNYRLHGERVIGYHLTNLAIHLAAAIVLYYLALAAIAALRRSYDAPPSLAAENALIERFVALASALLFICHPVQTQAVTYITQRYTSLATLFYLLAALLFSRARLAASLRNSLLFGAAAVGAALLAFGSKQIAATLPLMLLMLELALFRGRLLTRRFVITGGVLFGIAALALAAWHGGTAPQLLTALGQATAEDHQTARTTYFLTQTGVVATYLRLLCLPFGQSLVHDAPLLTGLVGPAAAALALHLLLFALAVALFRCSGQNLQSSQWVRGVLQRLAAVGIFWFYLAMAVESSVFPIRDVINEHRIYLPSAGFFMAIAALAALALHRRVREPLTWAWPLLVFMVVALGGMTIARNRVWSDPLTLWQEAAASAPHKWLALANLAGQYKGHNMPQQALALYVRALEADPEPFNMTNVYLGETLAMLNIYTARFTTGRELILPGGVYGSGRLDSNARGGWDGVIYNNLGLAYEYLHELDKAGNAYAAAVAANPAYDLAWLNMALLASRRGDTGRSAEALLRLRSLNQAMAGEAEMILHATILR